MSPRNRIFKLSNSFGFKGRVRTKHYIAQIFEYRPENSSSPFPHLVYAIELCKYLTGFPRTSPGEVIEFLMCSRHVANSRVRSKHDVSCALIYKHIRILHNNMHVYMKFFSTYSLWN